ncbi:HTH_48 domain-containing protein [Trichonephila clavipes]|nr:HTH_48 domain-containing protein [Trichonephila clavipes]
MPVGRTASFNEHVQLNSAGKVCKVNAEQRINIKFPVKLKKSSSETFQMLTEAYGDKPLSRACVLEGYKWFSGKRDSVKDNEPSGCQKQVITDENITEIHDVFRGDGKLSVHTVTALVNL